MEIQRYVSILISRKWVVILTTIVTLAVVTLGSFSMIPVYSASALVRVSTSLNSSATYTDLNYADRLIQTYVQLLTTRPFLDEVIRRLDLQVSPETLAEAIKVEALTSTELLKISAESTSPQQAAAIANTLGGLLAEQGQPIYQGQGKSAREILGEQVAVLEEQLRQDRALLATLSTSTPDSNHTQQPSFQDLTAKINAEEQTYATLLKQYDNARVDEAMRANSIGIVEQAVAPEIPSKPNVKLNIALGALVGLMGGIGLAFLFEKLSPLIHSTDDLEQTAGTLLLGRIPNFEIQGGNRLQPIVVNNGNAQSLAAAAFRVLGTSALALMTEAHLKTILITSAEPGAGKTTVLTNLAAAIGQAGRQVIVVDGDLRNPSVHTVFDLAQEPGLSDVLLDPSRLGSTLQTTKARGVRVLASGSVQADPAVVLNARAMPEVLQMLATEADMVLVDTPPMLAAADAAMLAPRVDGVVLIVERAQTQQEAVRAARQQLIDVKANLIGIIINRAKKNGRYNYYYAKPAQDGRRAGILKGIRRVDSGESGRESFNRQEK